MAKAFDRKERKGYAKAAKKTLIIFACFADFALRSLRLKALLLFCGISFLMHPICET
jgi:hypothetical protein